MKLIKKIFLVMLLASILISCSDSTKKEYALSVDETLNAYLHKDDILTVEKLANILLCKHDNVYQMIDLRTPPEYIKSHVKGAINIPAKNVLDMEYYDILNQDEIINVLYCRDKNQAINIYMILKQLGFKNIKVALGGYDYINEFIIAQYGIHSGDYNDEKPKYDYLRMVVGVEEPVQDSISAPKVIMKNPNKVVKDFDEECPDLN